MYFESVTCRAFGPFRNRTLSLKPGMNVIFGPNEAGKSTWSAAIAVGLCGRRRGRGARAEDRAFAQRHRPWDDPKEWEVSAVVHLADGRKIQISHDLAGGVESSAHDARYANRDVSSEIMNEGAPDGAVWLGLDRRSFQSIAYVRQSELLRILGDANSLQADLQRAAATARTDDATASDAVRVLEAFRHERVGTSRSPTRPLRQTQAAVEIAHDALVKAQEEHKVYRCRHQSIDALKGEVGDGKTQVAAAEAVLAQTRASAATERFTEAQRLNDCFPGGPPRESPERDQLAQRIVTVLDRWRKLADVLPPTGPTVVELTEQIAASEGEEAALLAARAEGSLAEAEQRLDKARELAALFPDAQRPNAPAEEDDLARRAATALEKWDGRPECLERLGPSVEEMEAELRGIDLKTTQLTETNLAVEVMRSAPPLGLGIVIVVAAMLALGGTILFWIGLLGLVSTGWWFLHLLASHKTVRSQRQADLTEQRRRLERAITTRQLDDRQHEENQEQLRQAEQAVRHAAADIGITADDVNGAVKGLRGWRLRRKKGLAEFKRLSDDWDALQRLLGGRPLAALANATEELEKQVKREVAAVSKSLLFAARERHLSPEGLAEFQREAEAERGRLRTALGRRQEEDDNYQQQSEARAKAATALAAAAEDAGVGGRDSEERATGLEQWLQRRRGEMATLDQRSQDWDRLQQLLGHSSLEELSQIATALTEEARSLSAELSPQSLAQARDLQTTESQITKLRSDLEEKKQLVQRSLGEIKGFRTTLPDLAQAEEALAAAKKERDRIAQLDSILTKTIGFLKAAEDRIHRDLAPVLQQGVLHRLSKVTGGRYVDCRVDPQTLTVDVSGRDRPWRTATDLSHGTAEQIYLLLRLALARHLGKREETCPLILDDPLGASDESRRNVLLETLLTISDERQLILFTHDVNVRTWAERHLTGPRNQLEELETVGIPV